MTSRLGRAAGGDDFEGRLTELGATISDPRAGVFGPDSVMWRVQREAGIFLGAGAALLLQTAHPFVAQGVADHSRALRDPLGRYYRTFRPVFAMIFGTREHALAVARTVRAVHARIRGTLPEGVGRWPAGTPYSADDARALLWVHLTLWHTSIAVHERLIGPLSQETKDRYARETGRFAGLFGIPNVQLPQNWSALELLFGTFLNSGELGVGGAGRLIGGYFIGQERETFGRLLPRWYRALTSSLLPPPIAEAFGLPPVSDIAAARLWRRLSLIYKVVPAPLREVGPALEARRRLLGQGPGAWASLSNRVWLGQPRLRMEAGA